MAKEYARLYRFIVHLPPLRNSSIHPTGYPKICTLLGHLRAGGGGGGGGGEVWEGRGVELQCHVGTPVD
jgi:hypothetical protein